MQIEWIVIASLSLLVCMLVVVIVLLRNQAHIIKKKLHAETEKLNQLQDIESRLQQELTGLQNKFQLVTDDPITHLLVWPLFEDRLNQAIKESSRYQFTLGLLFIAVDDFKMINDALNTEIGNAFLCEVAKRLETCIRQVDSVTRYGKETFVVLLTQLGKPEAAAIVAQRILQSLAQPMQIKGNEFYISAAIGIAVFPNDGDNAATLLRNADEALQSARQKGRHLYHFYQEKINIDSQRELILSTSMRRDSLYNELSLSFQPIMNVNNQTLFGVEALLRWQHPELGLIHLRELFIHAEKQHKLNSVSEWFIKKACQQFLQWRQQNIIIPYLAFPMHVKQLENSQFIYQFSQILQELKFDPQWLLIELKEVNKILTSRDVIEKALNMLRYLKVKLMLDNMDGTSLSHIQYFSPHYLRMPVTLVDEIESKPQAVAILKGLFYLANQLNIKIIAQGVNTAQQKSALQAMGYEHMQGDTIMAEFQLNDGVETLRDYAKTE